MHGNVRTSSVFISQSGEWRLGGLEILSSMKEDDANIYVRFPHRAMKLMEADNP